MKTNKNLKVVFFGSPSFVIPILSSLSEYFQVVGVVTSSDAMRGRKKLLAPSPVKQYCLEKLPAIPVLTPVKLDYQAVSDLQSLTPDLFVVAAYGQIIPQKILSLPRFGALNIHPSLLPKYRGTSPIQTMLLQGDKISGVTIIQMDQEMDHGPIVSQWEIPIKKTNSFESLHKVMFQDAATKLPKVIQNYIKGETKPIPQDELEATYCQKITRDSGYFDPNNPPSPVALDRMIRAYYPWPTAWTKVLLKKNETRRLKLLPGKRVQIEGGKAITAKDFLNGYPELRGFLNKLFGEEVEKQ